MADHFTTKQLIISHNAISDVAKAMRTAFGYQHVTIVKLWMDDDPIGSISRETME